MAAPAAAGGHGNRRRRTRKDLLEAAARLSADGHAPSMEEVAAEALVSRATIYRYFPNVETLLAEAAAHAVMPDPHTLFANDPATDPVARVDRAEAAMHAGMYAHEMPLRMTLAQARHYYQEGHFPAGSMGPKMMAAIEFVQADPGNRVIITNEENLLAAVEGDQGTHIVAY